MPQKGGYLAYKKDATTNDCEVAYNQPSSFFITGFLKNKILKYVPKECLYFRQPFQPVLLAEAFVKAIQAD